MFDLVAYVFWILSILERKEEIWVSDKITHEVTCCVHPFSYELC